MTMQQTRRSQLFELEHGPALYGNHNRSVAESRRRGVMRRIASALTARHVLLFAALSGVGVFQVFIDRGRYIWIPLPRLTYVCLQFVTTVSILADTCLSFVSHITMQVGYRIGLSRAHIER